MEIVLLADHPEAAETVARWTYEAWGRVDWGRTFEQELAMTRAFAGRDAPPIQILARDGGELVGTAVLKRHEMDAVPGSELWLSGVYVRPQARRRGVASRLVEHLKARARALGVERLYLQTEDPTGGLYARHDFAPVTTVVHRGVRVLVMVATVAPPGPRAPGEWV